MTRIRPAFLSVTVVGCLCAALLLTSSACADTYIFNFDTVGNPAPTSGGFTWNGTSFSNFDINWDGDTYDFTSAANAYDGRPDFPVNPCNPSNAAGLFSMLTLATVCPAVEWAAADNEFSNDVQFLFRGPQGADVYSTGIGQPDSV